MRNMKNLGEKRRNFGSVEFTFQDQEQQRLSERFSGIRVNPYKFYDAFLSEVQRIIDSDQVPARFTEYVASLQGRDFRDQPVINLKNAPYDRDVETFDYDDPVFSKYRLKTTYVGEAFLALFALMRKTPGIGYLNVNDGDVFQDIYPKRSLSNSQSQKALNDIYFHKDLANHFVRPDYVYMLGMRSDPVNEVYTSFVRNCDVLAAFSPSELALMRAVRFYTPFDDLTVAGATKKLGRAEEHSVLKGEDDIRYFENRTVGLDDEAKVVLAKLQELLHRHKLRLFVGPGDFIAVHNNFAIHAKEVVQVRNEDILRTRWIMKTVNVEDLDKYAEYMVPGSKVLVNG